MKTAYCPYCNNRTLIDDGDWGLTVRCEGPRCERFFTTAPLREIERLAAATALPANEEVHWLNVGDRVRVIDGSYAGAEAFVSQAVDARGRIQIQIPLVGSPVPVEIDQFQVEVIAPPPAAAPRPRERKPNRTNNTPPKAPPKPAAETLPRFNFRDAPKAAPTTQPTRRLLTGPHRCQVCQAEMNEALGKRRVTVLHRNPERADNCRTDVYAALYHCPSCLAPLETPSDQWGQQVTCPVESCRHVFTAPRDDLLHRHAGDGREGVLFDFPCGGCGGRLRCDTLRDGKPTTGLLAVCVHCNQIVHVPASGKQVGTAPSAIDPVQAVQSVPERRCRGCNGLVPANAVPCPLCGHPEFEVISV